MKNIIIPGIVALIISVMVGLLSGSIHLPGQQQLGALPISPLGFNAVADQGFNIGPLSGGAVTGTRMTFMANGTCTATFSGTSLAATSTGQFFCTVPNVQSGDRVFVNLPSTARTGAGQWFEIADSYATTSNRIGFDIANWSGAATTSFAQATTGIQYLVIR